MPRTCNNPDCEWKIIEYPIYEGQEQGISFLEGNTPQEKWKSLFTLRTWKKRWNWRNIIIGDWTKMLILITLIFVALSYTHDSEAYREIYKDPCNYVMKNIDACLEFEKNESIWIGPDLEVMKINLSRLEGAK